MSAILFGSISTVADTSELQREAFNRAFEAHGLTWHWSRQDYLAMLDKNGGEKRIAEYASARGETVDPTAIHQSKSDIFQRSLAGSDVTARAGVVETIEEAKRRGVKVGFVTTTSADNISALLDSLAPAIRRADFDTIVSAADVATPKPDSAAYRYALDSLGEAAEDCVAIEDNLGGVEAAEAAGVTCVAFPNENTAGHDFSAARHRSDRLDIEQLQEIISGTGRTR